MTWNISLFTFRMICNFSKCDTFTVLSCKQYLSNSVVLSLLPHQKNSYLNEERLFIGRIKIGSLPRMINKEVLAQFIYKPT